MTPCLGLPLDEAVAILEKEGKKVKTVLVACRKGALGDEKRVIRSRMQSDGSVELAYSVFKTVAGK